MGAPQGPEHDPTTSGIVRSEAAITARFASLYERLSPSIAAWIRLRIGPSLKETVPPEDFMQELWCRALRAFGTFDADRGAFRAWIFGIARHLMLEILRSSARSPGNRSQVISFAAIPDEATAVSVRACRDESMREFLRTARTLPDADRDLLLWRGLEGIPHEEIAARLGIDREAAMKRWQRLRDRIQAMAPVDDLIAN